MIEKRSDNIKTIKALKITSILNSIFCFCCITFVICLTVNQYYAMAAIKAIGVITTFGWMFNPTPIVLFVICLVFFLVERHSDEAKQKIGKKYIWIFLWPVITALFYFVAIGFLVEITGGV